MDIKFIDVYTAHGDGGDNSIGPVIAYCSTESIATSAAKGRAWYGGNGCVCKTSAVVIDGSVYILETRYPIDLDGIVKAQKEKLRFSGIEKLTLAEIEALGIKL